MIPKKYTSFEQIDQDLKILKLEQEIGRENFKMHVQITKNSLYPTHLLGGFSGIIQKLTLSMVAKKLLKKFN
ncbi:hypothetical protein SAMN05421766_101281 [Zobellia uliginosa]|uniref:Glutaminyl-tRNA synthetase n=1 Tax=Zobellia uliginosa TaxID=143224 RepID=A0ABY1KIB1_9FLAO|nr:DUF6327 family protein [Zobellia uliginosa]MDO6516151.1 DUF6327 family protein [Zobellia uliginosa]SIS38424.1 hypothetical protein SAMN05421766_101281 [Zobellia uliginosa]